MNGVSQKRAGWSTNSSDSRHRDQPRFLRAETRFIFKSARLDPGWPPFDAPPHRAVVATPAYVTSLSEPAANGVERRRFSSAPTPAPLILKYLDQIIIVIRPEAPIWPRSDGLRRLDDHRLQDERLVARHDDPVARGAAALAGLVEVGVFEAVALGDGEQHRLQVEEAVRDVEGDDPLGLHVPQVLGERLDRDEVNRDRIAREGVHHQHVEALRSLALEAQAS